MTLPGSAQCSIEMRVMRKKGVREGGKKDKRKKEGKHHLIVWTHIVLTSWSFHLAYDKNNIAEL